MRTSSLIHSVGALTSIIRAHCLSFDPTQSSHRLYSSTSLSCEKASSSAVEPGHVYFVATPLGNLKDMTTRAVEVLTEVDLICAEDTRHTINLLRHFKLPQKKMMSHHEHNWAEQIPKIVGLLQSGSSVAVVSDAGTPGISDPGAQLADACLAQNIPVHPIPGPSAVVAALSCCGFQASEFSFFGFLPVKGKERASKMQRLINTPCTVVFFEAPHRIEGTFQELSELGQGDRMSVCCRELTKVHEEFRRGTVDQNLRWLRAFPDAAGNGDSSARIRGEFTVVLGPAITPVEDEATIEDRIQQTLTKLRADGVARSEAVKLACQLLDQPKSVVYKIALDIKPW